MSIARFIYLTAIVALVVSCSQESDFTSGNNLSPSVITDDVSVNEFCSGKNLVTVKKTLVFEPDTTVCAWGEDGNQVLDLSTFTSFIQINAVQSYTQEIDLGVPVGSICDFSLSMNEEFTVYDDDITFTFDQYAFAGDFLNREWLRDVAELEEVGDLLRYDRLKVIGQETPQEEEWLEQGVVGEFNIEQNDSRQREGNFNLELTRDFLDLMPRDDLKQQVHEFGFHIFGNVHDNDCTHQGFTIDVEVSFVPVDSEL